MGILGSGSVHMANRYAKVKGRILLYCHCRFLQFRSHLDQGIVYQEKLEIKSKAVQFLY